MDLEVSEPIDFSSGDHQQLVRKAANKNTQSKSGQHNPPASSRPQETRRDAPLTDAEKSNTYVVQITDDSTQDESTTNLSSPFSDASVRRNFITKVFLILSVQLLVTAAIISVFVFWNGLREWVKANPWFTYVTFPAFFVVLIILTCCGKLLRHVPVNYIFLGLFTVLQGLMLGAVTSFYKVHEVLWATAATTLVTLALTLFALQTKWDFTLLHGMLFVLTIVLIVYGIFLIFLPAYWLHLLYAGLGTVIFSLYLVMDVQLMMGGRHRYSLDPEEYVFAALNIYLDLINLFLFILQLVAHGR
ncbi:protein lifeguard 2-like [Eulemur rufifrons]|uniref:protein lifeguard 2-like n=1 Tax=Eulemur rufifrons TaxID=859984 RepID=UPI0037434606